jgi:beta-glucosidase-like glycosyl hydrolase
MLRRRYLLIAVVVLFWSAGCASAPEGEPDTDGVVDRTGPTSTGVEERLAAMSLREKLGQRFLIYVPRGFGRDETHVAAEATTAAPDPTTTAEGNAAATTAADAAAAATPGAAPSGRNRSRQSVAQSYVSLLKEGVPAGMIVYPWNYRDRVELQELTTKLQILAKTNPLGGSFLIAADQESGRVAAYRFFDLPRFPSAAVMARQAGAGAVAGPGGGRADADGNAAGNADQNADAMEYIRSQAYITGRDLRTLGININFAPVLDLTDRPDGSIIGDRSWGPDPEVVSSLATAYVEGLTRAGTIATVKHFPGHGVTRVDSHGRLPIVDMTMDDLARRDLKPFVAAMDQDVPAVMTAHILFPLIDPDYPVTVSEVFLHDLLRDELGYQGVVVSDGLSMGALRENYDIDLVLERALRYDVDLILLHDRYDYRDILQRAEGLVATGRVTEDDIDRGVRRVLRLKEQYGLLD